MYNIVESKTKYVMIKCKWIPAMLDEIEYIYTLLKDY